MLLRRLAFALSLLAAPAAMAQAPDRPMTIVGFGGGFQEAARKALFQPWAASAGVALRDEAYNGEMARLYAMVRARDVVWDLVMVEAPELQRGCEDGIFTPIDWSALDRTRFPEGGTTRCGAGAVAWGTAIFWDEARTPQGPASFAELWDTARFPGKRAFRASPKATLEMALLADGVAPADLYKVLATKPGQDRAFARLEQLRPQIVWWRSGAQPVQLVGSGEVAYAAGFTGRVVQARAQGQRLAMNWNTLVYSIDYWAIPRGTPYAAQALRMIDTITDRPALEALGRIWPASPAHRAWQDDAALRAANPDSVATHAAEGLFIDTEFWVQYGEDLERRFAAWSSR